MGEPAEEDPYGIVPSKFVEKWAPDGDSVAEALRRAERAPSTTDEDDRPRCPYCGSISVEQRTSRSFNIKPDADAWICRAQGCRREFEEPGYDTIIPMTDNRTDPFDWVEPDDRTDPDERGEGPLFASLDEETRIALAIVLYRPWTDAGPSLRELAELFPHTRYWVGERNREWKDGDHRDLVPDPRTNTDPTPEADAGASPQAAADGGRPGRRWDAYGSD